MTFIVFAIPFASCNIFAIPFLIFIVLAIPCVICFIFAIPFVIFVVFAIPFFICNIFAIPFVIRSIFAIPFDICNIFAIPFMIFNTVCTIYTYEPMGWFIGLIERALFVSKNVFRVRRRASSSSVSIIPITSYTSLESKRCTLPLWRGSLVASETATSGDKQEETLAAAASTSIY